MASQSTPDKNGSKSTGTLKTGLAQMLKGGVIMDVVTAEHAKIAEEAGAVAVMALERVPADIRAAGGGQGPHRPLRRSADPGSHRGRLRRRERGPDPGRSQTSHRQARLQSPVR